MVGAGVTVSNATLVCANQGAGFFTATPQSLGIANGVVLTTGLATDIANPNNDAGVSHEGWTPGDAQLGGLAGNVTNDACILEFDVVPQGDTLKFDYIFGSEEYNEFVGSQFNDVFAFFISGPGIPGQQNIARIPGTNMAVTINNVNCGSYGQYYVCNDYHDPLDGGCGGQCPNGQQFYAPEFDGLTTVLTAKAIVQPCQTYHMKLAVADVGDRAWDSGVFLKQGSLTSAPIEISPDASICPDGSTELNVYGAGSTASYQWSPAEGLSCVNCKSPDASPAVTTTYTVVISYGADCTTSKEVVITVNPEVEATFTTNPSACVVPTGSINTNVTSGLSPYTFNWSNGQSGQNITNVASGQHDVTVTDANGCSAAFTTFVGLQNAPSTSGTVTNSTCESANGFIDLNITGGTPPYAFAWNNGEVNQDPNALVEGTYTVTVTDAEQCTIVDTFTVSTTTNPAVSFSTVAPVCTAANGSIAATVTNGTSPFTFVWNTGIAQQNLSNVTAGVYAITVTDNLGCTAMANVDLVAELPPTLVLNGLVDSICVGSSFGVRAMGYDAYAWYPENGLNHVNDDSVSVNVSVDRTYSVVGTDANGCIDTAVFDVTAVPYAEVTYTDTFGGCEPLQVHLEAYPQNAVSVQWWLNDKLASTKFEADKTLPAGTYDGMLIAVSPIGCNDTVTMPGFINVLESPEADFAHKLDAASGSLFAFDFTNLTTGANAYHWNFSDGAAYTQTDVHHVFSGYGFYTVLLTAYNDLGCSDTALHTVNVFVPHDIFIPNTFTPNGDGMNDDFRAYGLGIDYYTVHVYDRIGEKVFEGNDDGRSFWDGTFKGQPLNTGTYVYMIDVKFLDGRSQTYRGDINLLR